MKKLIIGSLLMAMTLAGGMESVNAQVVVKVRPVRPKAVAKPVRPAAGHVWIAGHWKWNKRAKKYNWVAGHWVKPRRGYIYKAGYWRTTPKGHVWVTGRWVRA